MPAHRRYLPTRRAIRRRAVTSLAAAGSAALGAALLLPSTHRAAADPGAPDQHAGLGQLASVSDRFVASTIDPATGDLNPYGVAVVPVTKGTLVQGDVLVGDFGSYSNPGGAGQSIVEIDPATGAVTDWSHSPTLDGVDSLSFNPKGFLWTGDLGPVGPGGTDDGSNANIAILGTGGQVAATFDQATTGHGFFAGTWGQEYGQNAAGKVSFYWPDAGTGADAGTVWRLDPNPTGTPNGQPTNATYTLLATIPAGGPTAAVPTVRGGQGQAYDAATDTLYVADDADSTVYAIPNASTVTGPQTPRVVLRGGPLNAPQGIVLDPATGDLLVANGADNNLVDLAPSGRVLGVRNLAPDEPPGALFGLAIDPAGTGRHATTVFYDNDNENSLHELTILRGDG